MPQRLTVAVAQARTQATREATLQQLKEIAEDAAKKNVAILLFPEAYLGGYPRQCSFGAVIGKRLPQGYDQFHAYLKEAVDLGDTAIGAGDDWLNRELPVNEQTGRRGDGTREFLEDVAKSTGVFLVVGCVERVGASMYCAAVLVDPAKGIVGKRRKLQPTGMERLVWSQGQASSLKAVAVTIKGVRVVIGTAICWENFMPLLRYSLYAQGVNLFLAPTADARPTWEPLMQTIAGEGRCWVVSGNQAVKAKDLPEWITAVDGGQKAGAGLTNGTASDTKAEEWVSRGGSLIVNPMGLTVAGPVWEQDRQLIISEIDFDECDRAKFDFDAAGHYARLDSFELNVDGLDLIPPP
ncbi:hypothetical protein DV735_g3821, partial [Chaetothyriales sp. CBS 134920]